MPTKLPRLTEAAFMQQVAQLAKIRGWRIAHFRPARTKDGWRTACQFDAVGWPDMVLVRRERLVFAELKVGANVASAAQAAWLTALADAGMVCYVWRPELWAEIEAVLA